MHQCPNCETESSDRYCPRCGQDNSSPRLEARKVLSNTFQNLVGWDAALWRTLRGLVVNPGAVVVDYVEGKRRRYVNPARFCLLAIALMFALAHLAEVDLILQLGVQVNMNVDESDAPKLAMEVRDFISRNLNVLLYLALPGFALLMRMAFRKSGRNLAECLVLVLYLAGVQYLLTILLFPAHHVSQLNPNLIKISIVLIWTVRASRTFFDTSLWGCIWRVLLCKLGHLILTLLIFGGISIPWVLLTSENL